MKRAALLLLLAGCKSSVPPPPDGWVEVPTHAPAYDAGADRDGLGTDIGEACAELRALGCPEGQPDALRTCYEHLVIVSAVWGVPAVCLRRATSAADVRKCGAEGEMTFRCPKGDAG